jgi:hypothetical protein
MIRKRPEDHISTELLRTKKLSMIPVMSGDEIGEIKDELRAYKAQLDALP